MLNSAHIKKILCSLWLVSSLLLGSYNYISHDFSKGDEKVPQKKSTVQSTSQQLQGEVEVSFKIDGDGKANILSIESENPELVDYIKLKLNKIQLEKDDINIDEIITYRFIFKKEA